MSLIWFRGSAVGIKRGLGILLKRGGKDCKEQRNRNFFVRLHLLEDVFRNVRETTPTKYHLFGL